MGSEGLLGRGYDPVALASIVRSKVSEVINGEEYRKYFRFRGGKWYGGIATGDVIGCNLRCGFCWAWYFRDDYTRGELLSPKESWRRLYKIASKRGYRLVRLSGGEPTLTRDHVLKVAELARRAGMIFVLETNGILIGNDRSYARDLAELGNVFVRVSFKGVTSQEFARLTGARPEFFELQFQALRNLISEGMEPGEEVIAAAMISFSNDEDIARFVLRLTEIDERLARVDWEVIFMYPHVKEILRRSGLKPKRFVDPEKIPGEMV